MFTLTPELLQKGLTGLGIAAGQLRNLDAETRIALGRFFVAAVGSGDVNGYIKERLALLERLETERHRPATTARATVLEAEFVDDPRGRRK